MGRLLAGLLVLAVLGCRGGDGARCQGPEDCRGSRRCELGQCVGEEHSACAYLRRCLRRPTSRAPALLGARLVRDLDSHPDEEACRARLRLLGSTGQGDALVQACGPRLPQ